MKYKVILCALILSGCHQVKDEGATSDTTMDEGERQVMMQQEFAYPQQEEGMIPSPSDELRGSEPLLYPVMD